MGTTTRFIVQNTGSGNKNHTTTNNLIYRNIKTCVFHFYTNIKTKKILLVIQTIYGIIPYVSYIISKII